VCSVRDNLCVWHIHWMNAKSLGTFVIYRLKSNVNTMQLILWSCLCCTWQNLLLSKHEFGVVSLYSLKTSICRTCPNLSLTVHPDTHSCWSLEGWSHSGVETPWILVATCWSFKHQWYFAMVQSRRCAKERVSRDLCREWLNEVVLRSVGLEELRMHFPSQQGNWTL
jgi:hypothetical protein